MLNEIDLRIWGKWDDKKKAMHPALLHMVDTGFVIQELLGTFSTHELDFVSKKMNLNINEAKTFLTFMMPLHDLGKITPEFIKQVEEAADLIKDDYCFYPNDEKIRHELFSMHLLKNVLLPDFAAKNDVCAVIGGHHGKFSILPSKFPPKKIKRFKRFCGRDDEKWCKQQKLAYDFLTSIFPISEEILNKVNINPDLYFFLAGLISNADWIASDSNLFPLSGFDQSLDQYVVKSKGLAKKAFKTIDWNLCKIKNQQFDETFGFLPYPSQKIIINEIEKITSPCLMIIEESTGSGKTEIAQHSASFLMSKLKHRGIQMWSPTRTTSDSVFKRMVSFLRKTVDGKANIQHIHSNSKRNKDYLELKNKDNDDNATVVAKYWFSSGRKRLMSQFSTGTVDQIMKGAIYNKYFYMPLYASFNKVVIIDEIHSYDVFMGNLIEVLIEKLKEMNCSIILLSATLSNSTRRKLINAYGAEANDEITRYPRLTVCQNNNSNCTQLFTHRHKKIKLEHLHLNPPTPQKNEIKSYDELAQKALCKIENGGAINIVCNTVKQSQKIYNAFKSLNASPLLLHSGFTKKDRSRIEQNIIDKYGKEYNSKRDKTIVIGTQIIEQSLDIDFDYTFSFICPIDFLIQRLGRLWRFYRTNEFEIPNGQIGFSVFSKTPEATIIYEYSDEKELESYGIYSSYIMHLTQKNITPLDEVVLPDMTDLLINNVYEQIDIESNNQEEKLKKKYNKAEQDANSESIKVTLSKDNKYTLNEENNYDDSNTRDISTPTMNVILLFKKGNNWTLGEGMPNINFRKKEFSSEEINLITQNSCPISGKPLFNYFNNNKFSEWKNIFELKYYSILILEEDGKQTIYGDNWKAELQYDSTIGLCKNVFWQ